MTARRVVLYAATGGALAFIAACAVILRVAYLADVIKGSRDR